jgi:fructose-1,6-bisphosphatase/inositol monophosphatase family enzyme
VAELMPTVSSYGVHCWDIAAAVVIMREAGGVCIMPKGEGREGGGREREREEKGERGREGEITRECHR